MKKTLFLVLVFFLVLAIRKFYHRPSVLGQEIQPSPVQKIISQLNPLAESATLDKNILTIRLRSGTLLILDIEKSPDTWYSSLQELLNRAQVTGRYPSRIDFRGSRSIVSY